MNSFATVKLVPKRPSPGTELFVGEKVNLRDCLDLSEHFLTEVILMDNTNTPPAGGLQIPTEVRDFLEGILKDANMTYADEAMHEELINELFARLDNYMTSQIVENMPPEFLDEFIKMNGEKKSQAEIESYLKEKIPNAQDVLTKAFINFRDMYLTSVGIARNAPEENGSKPAAASDGSAGEPKGGNE